MAVEQCASRQAQLVHIRGLPPHSGALVLHGFSNPDLNSEYTKHPKYRLHGMPVFFSFTHDETVGYMLYWQPDNLQWAISPTDSVHEHIRPLGQLVPPALAAPAQALAATAAVPAASPPPPAKSPAQVAIVLDDDEDELPRPPAKRAKLGKLANAERLHWPANQAEPEPESPVEFPAGLLSQGGLAHTPMCAMCGCHSLMGSSLTNL